VETSTSSDDSEQEFRKHAVEKMDSQNPMTRLAAFGRVKKVVSSYHAQALDPTDRRLMRGLLIKRLKDYDEDHEIPW
jgi:hypothetical protein